MYGCKSRHNTRTFQSRALLQIQSFPVSLHYFGRKTVSVFVNNIYFRSKNTEDHLWLVFVYELKFVFLFVFVFEFSAKYCCNFRPQQ